MAKYVKVMFGTTSGANSDLEYKLNEINTCNNWNPSAEKGRDFGGYNYCEEDSILRWLHRGDTIYDVIIPQDAEVVKIQGATTLYRANKIIIKNPRKINDDDALYYYEISNIPEKSYYKALGVLSIMNYKKAAYAILKDKVNENNIDEVVEEWNSFISHDGKDDRKDVNELVLEVERYLYEIKSSLLISRFIDKEPYQKKITEDNIINLTGESGSGKSYFSSKYINDDNYIVIDTDVVFSDKESDNKESIELRKLFKDKTKDYILTEFDNFYKMVLEYYKNSDKTLVIDSAQYRNLKDYSLLKGEIIVMRTSIEKCYERTLNRWKSKNEYNEEKFKEFSNKKQGIFSWYKSLNKFLEKVNEL